MLYLELYRGVVILAKRRPTKEQIVVAIRKKAERDGTDKLNLRDIASDPFCPSLYYIRLEYPDPADAIRAAGLFPSYPNNVDLILSLWKFHDEYGKVPRAIDALNGYLVYDLGTYKAHLGNNWRKVLVAAGLLEDESDESWNAMIAEALVREVKMLYGPSGYLPTQDEHNANIPLHDAQYIMRYIGGWEVLAQRTELQLKPTSLRSVHSNATTRKNRAAQ